LFQLVDFPTRENNILDLIFVNNPCFVSNVNICQPLGSSDHNGVELTIQFDAKNVFISSVDVRKTVFLFDKANRIGLHNCFANTEWIAMFSCCISIEDY